MRISIIHMLLLLSVFSYGQTSLTNKGNLRIFNGASLNITGDLNNTVTASLENNGQLFVGKDLINDQTSMTRGTGTLNFNGTVGQTLSGSASFKTFNLVTDNGGGITLMSDLGVSGTHSFVNGLIFSSANYLIYEPGSSYSGDNDSRHVNGLVRKNGSSDFSFPVGDNSYERPVAVSNLTDSSQINCSYYRNTQNIFDLSSPLVQVDAEEYWRIENPTGTSARVTLTWDQAKVPFPNVLIGDVLVANYKNSHWTSLGGTATGNVNSTGSITSDLTNSFGAITFGATSFPVPLRLISFKGERRVGVTLLHWVSENEQDVSHYEIERSEDGIAFRLIGQLPAMNNFHQSYDFTDGLSMQNRAWYRLRMIDQDGSQRYSSIIMLSENTFNVKAFTVTNPVSGTLMIINNTVYSCPFGYCLINASGQILAKGKLVMQPDSPVILNMPSNIPTGVYWFKISGAEPVFIQKILLKN